MFQNLRQNLAYQFKKDLKWLFLLFLAVVVFISVLILFVLFSINISQSSSYVVPFPPDGTLGFSLPGSFGGSGLVDCAGAGAPVVVPNAQVMLTPDTTYCINPTAVIIHWSGAWASALATYNAMISGNHQCHFAIDNTTTLQMMRFNQNAVERSISCSNEANDFGVAIEMSGLCFSETPISACTDASGRFIITPPPEGEIQRTVDIICWLKRQYGISQIIGHYEIPGGHASGKTDPGDQYGDGLPNPQSEFLYTTLIPRVNSQCP